MPNNPAHRIRKRDGCHPPLLDQSADSEFTATLRSDQEFMTAASQVTSISTTTETVSTFYANKSRGRATQRCKTVTVRKAITGLFGQTVLSFKLKLQWCYNGSRVFYKSYEVIPDVTSHGALGGWKFKGFWQPLDRHYHSWNGHEYGGYTVKAYPEFEQSQAGVSIDQKLGHFAVVGHYDGTFTTRAIFN